MKSKTTFLLVTAISIMALSQSARAGEWVNGTASTATGKRNYKLWVPSGLIKRRSVPLVMMPHGCMQQPEDLATISGMNTVADRNSFLVVYPEQPVEANPLRCWNWSDPKHQSRDIGEPALLAAVIKQVKASHSIDTDRTFVVGISAGAAMAVVMGVTYHEFFNGIGVCSGLEFKAGTSAAAGLAAMKQGGPDPKEQGLAAFKLMAEHLRGNSKRRMPVIVFQGDADPYVNTLNAEQVIAQWARTNDYLDDRKSNNSVKSAPARTIEGTVPAGHEYRRYVYRDRTGRLLMEKWIVNGLGHAWSGSPAAVPFGDPKGPNASEEIWRFFKAANLSSPSPKPKAARRKGKV